MWYVSDIRLGLRQKLVLVPGIALQAWIGFCESCRLDHLEWIRGCHEYLRQERVRILHDGRNDLL